MTVADRVMDAASRRTLGKWVATLLLVAPLVGSSRAAAGGFDTQKLRALLSANNTKGQGGSDWTVAWSLDGQWKKRGRAMDLNLTLDSDYSKSDTAKLDRLRTGWRFLSSQYGKQTYKWYPVYLLQTEGDHTGDSIHTLGAFGYRQKRSYGFFELTAGASKNLRGHDQWVGDIGFQLGYQRKLGSRWTFRTGPKGEVGALGDVRVRGDRLRYSWDVQLDYAASDKMSIGYRLWSGNTVPNSRRTQWLGLSYKWK